MDGWKEMLFTSSITTELPLMTLFTHLTDQPLRLPCMMIVDIRSPPCRCALSPRRLSPPPLRRAQCLGIPIPRPKQTACKRRNIIAADARKKRSSLVRQLQLANLLHEGTGGDGEREGGFTSKPRSTPITLRLPFSWTKSRLSRYWGAEVGLAGWMAKGKGKARKIEVGEEVPF